MSEQPRPEPGVEYAAFPTLEFAEARPVKACESLARALGVTPERALAMLGDGTAGEEIRALRGLTGPEALRQLERRAADPSLFAG